MTLLRVNGVTQQPVPDARPNGLTPERLRTIVESAHLNFLIGAGTSSAYFARLGNIELALTELADSEGSEFAKQRVRASIQAYFFDNVLVPNREIVDRDVSAEPVLTSYATFLRTLNRILLKRHSALHAKQANLFTTNVDMVFEVAMEQLGVDFSDGFSGKIRPRFDLGDFNTLRYRMGSRYEHRSEVPVFNLVKLHGSAAWKQETKPDGKREIYFDHGLTLVNHVEGFLSEARRYLLDVLLVPQPKGQGPTLRSVPDLLAEAEEESLTDDAVAAVRDFAASYEQLGIVNPDKRKFATTVLNQTYYELIRRFANELEKENSVLFTHGFSFRDEHLRDLVLRAARMNPTLQVIVFCYSRADRIAYEELLPVAEVKNGNVQLVAPSEPVEGQEERHVTLDVLDSDYFEPIVRDKIPEFDQRIELDIRTPNAGPTDA